MNTTPPEWNRLASAARKAKAEELDALAPFGFATRVVALAFTAPERTLASILDRFSWKALGIASLLMVGCVAANINPILSLLEEEVSTFGDPVAELVAMS